MTDKRGRQANAESRTNERHRQAGQALDYLLEWKLRDERKQLLNLKFINRGYDWLLIIGADNDQGEPESLLLSGETPMNAILTALKLAKSEDASWKLDKWELKRRGVK